MFWLPLTQAFFMCHFNFRIKDAGIVIISNDPKSVLADRYRASHKLASLADAMKSVDIDSIWSSDGLSFCYAQWGISGREFFIVDVADGQPRLVLNQAQLDAVLMDASELVNVDLGSLAFVGWQSANSLGADLELHLASPDHRVTLIRPFPDAQWSASLSPLYPERSYSPDGAYYAYVRDYDLFLVDADTGHERRLTSDGNVDHAYAVLPDAVTTKIIDQIRGLKAAPQLVWSPDSSRFLTYRMDQRGVAPMPIMQHIFAGDDAPRPVVHFPRLHTPGDANIAVAELMVFRVCDGAQITIDHAPLMMAYSLLAVGARAGEISAWRFMTRLVWWGDDGAHLYFLHEERGYGKYSLVSADPVSGATRIVVTELKGEGRYAQPSINRYPPQILIDEASGQVLFFSQRDGWGHVYRYNLAGTDDLIGQVTSGDWNVESIARVDRDGGILLSGLGREMGRDPYYSHFYHVSCDGNITLLTPENADHQITLSPDGKHFVDVYSTVDQPPVAVLRRINGEEVSRIAVFDFAPLAAVGWTLPQRFCVTAPDGETQLYGVLYRPADWSADHRYPILDYTYGSQSMCWSKWRFHLAPAQGLANLGFYVVTIEGRSTPLRSRAFRDAFDYRGASGIADHVPTIIELARRDPCIDLDRVGVYGDSGGGYSATRAILEFPDFFKVAVSNCGNNDQRLYSLQVGERYLGMPDAVPEVYFDQATKRLAGNLKGQLLLIHGMLDETVNPTISFQLAQALIEKGKRFDMMLFPDGGHTAKGWYMRNLQWNYFTTHLLGAPLPFTDLA
jgi:dipeptidyl-peptidase 4